MSLTLDARTLRGPAWTAERELMDEPSQDADVLAGNLADLASTNRWLGGTALTLRAIATLVRDLPPGSGLTFLDVATGGADIPRSVTSWARARGLQVCAVATDLSLQMLSIARQRSGADATGLTLAAADARRLPFRDRSVDIAMCSLALHHMRPAEAVTMLRELRRVARRGVIVNDIVRCWHGYFGGWLFGRLRGNPLTRHDAPLSFRRAYTRDEMVQLASEAGVAPVSFESFLGFRVAMVFPVPNHPSTAAA